MCCRICEARARSPRSCRTTRAVPLPRSVPEVAWRAGVDLNPLDVGREDNVRWLECLVWPDQPERLTRLRGAIRIAQAEPAHLVRGDLTDRIPGWSGRLRPAPRSWSCTPRCSLPARRSTAGVCPADPGAAVPLGLQRSRRRSPAAAGWRLAQRAVTRAAPSTPRRFQPRPYGAGRRSSRHRYPGRTRRLPSAARHRDAPRPHARGSSDGTPHQTGSPHEEVFCRASSCIWNASRGG